MILHINFLLENKKKQAGRKNCSQPLWFTPPQFFSLLILRIHRAMGDFVLVEAYKQSQWGKWNDIVPCLKLQSDQVEGGGGDLCCCSDQVHN